jgi:acyl-CoA hydrolase
MNPEIVLRPCTDINDAKNIRANGSREFPFISINTAVGVDLGGNVWADYVNMEKYLFGVGGGPDFARALNDPEYGVAIIAMLSTAGNGKPKIVQAHPAGVTLTICSYDNVVVVTEHGIADLRGLSAGCKARALASIADDRVNPETGKSIRDTLFDYINSNPRMFVTPRQSRNLSGLIPYDGDTSLE